MVFIKILANELYVYLFICNYLWGCCQPSEVPNLGWLVEGTIWAKWPKTAWKLQNQHFGGKIVGGHKQTQANFSGSAGSDFHYQRNPGNVMQMVFYFSPGREL